MSTGVGSRLTSQGIFALVELSPAEFQALEAACKGRCLTAPEFIKLVALRLARAL